MKKSRGGFTLIEMALSLVFIGILSVFMVLMIQNTTTSYRRGLILNRLNTVGMDLIDDIRASIQGAAADSLLKLCQRVYGGDGGACASDNGNSFSMVTKYGKVKINSVDAGTIPVYGAFCTGTYTYIWNSGYFEDGEYGQKREVFKIGGGTDKINPVKLVSHEHDTNVVAQGFRLLKIYDRERTICRNANDKQPGGGYHSIPSATATGFVDYNRYVPEKFEINDSMRTGDLSDPNKEGGVELLKSNVMNDLVLYDLYMTRPAMSETRQNLFFAGSFILGTRRGGINITTSGNSCKPPSEEYSDLEYCAINKFNFAVQAGGD